MEANVINKAGEETGKKVKLNEEIFGITPNDHAIYLDVKHYMANNRQGTHKTKERSEIVGSTKKIKRQKGTGTARAGSIKSPIFRGGGRTFGPLPRSYSFKLNKKLKKLARKSALSYKAKDNGILVIEDFQLEQVKTKEFCSVLENLNLIDKKALMVLPEPNKNIYLSSRNLQKSEVVIPSELTTYKILDASVLVLFESAIEKIEETFKN